MEGNGDKGSMDEKGVQRRVGAPQGAGGAPPACARVTSPTDKKRSGTYAKTPTESELLIDIDVSVFVSNRSRALQRVAFHMASLIRCDAALAALTRGASNQW